MKHIIDCDVLPTPPHNETTICKHVTHGRLVWDKDRQKEALYICKGQYGQDSMPAMDILTELRDKPVLNANVLEYLLNNQDAIPNEWRNENLFYMFWGTLYYNHAESMTYVRSLHFYPDRRSSLHSPDLEPDGGREGWRSSLRWLERHLLGSELSNNYVAVLRA